MPHCTWPPLLQDNMQPINANSINAINILIWMHENAFLMFGLVGEESSTHSGSFVKCCVVYNNAMHNGFFLDLEGGTVGL